MLGKQTLLPKEKTSLTISYATKDRPGPFRKIVSLNTEIPGQEEMEITVEGDVRETPAAIIHANPRKIVLSHGDLDSSRIQEITIGNSGNAPLIIEKIYCRGSGEVYFDGSRGGDITIAPGATKKIELRVTLHWKKGQDRDLIAIKSNARNAPKSGYVLMVQYNGTQNQP